MRVATHVAVAGVVDPVSRSSDCPLLTVNGSHRLSLLCPHIGVLADEERLEAVATRLRVLRLSRRMRNADSGITGGERINGARCGASTARSRPRCRNEVDVSVRRTEGGGTP